MGSLWRYECELWCECPLLELDMDGVYECWCEEMELLPTALERDEDGGGGVEVAVEEEAARMLLCVGTALVLMLRLLAEIRVGTPVRTATAAADETDVWLRLVARSGDASREAVSEGVSDEVPAPL